MILPALLAVLTPEQGLNAVDRLQGNWEKGWQSATAAVLLVLLVVSLVLYWRSQHLRVSDKDRMEDKLERLVKESAAAVMENGKQTVLHMHLVTELRAEVAQLRRMLEDLR